MAAALLCCDEVLGLTGVGERITTGYYDGLYLAILHALLHLRLTLVCAWVSLSGICFERQL